MCFKIRLQRWWTNTNRGRKNKTLNAIKTKWGVRISGRDIHGVHTEKVRELMFQKYFKILLVYKLQYLKQQGSH